MNSVLDCVSAKDTVYSLGRLLVLYKKQAYTSLSVKMCLMYTLETWHFWHCSTPAAHNVVQCQNNSFWLLARHLQDLHLAFIIANTFISLRWPWSTSSYVALVLTGKSWHAKIWNTCVMLFHFCQTNFKTSQWVIWGFHLDTVRGLLGIYRSSIWSYSKYCYYCRLFPTHLKDQHALQHVELAHTQILHSWHLFQSDACKSVSQTASLCRESACLRNSILFSHKLLNISVMSTLQQPYEG